MRVIATKTWTKMSMLRKASHAAATHKPHFQRDLMTSQTSLVCAVGALQSKPPLGSTTARLQFYCFILILEY